MQDSGLASFTVIMLDSVPSSLRLGLKPVLFFVTMLRPFLPLHLNAVKHVSTWLLLKA